MTIEFFGVFGFFIMALLVLILVYAFIFGICYIRSFNLDDVENIIVTNIAFITIIAAISTTHYECIQNRIYSNTISENVIDINVEDLKEQK